MPDPWAFPIIMIHGGGNPLGWSLPCWLDADSVERRGFLHSHLAGFPLMESPLRLLQSPPPPGCQAWGSPADCTHPIVERKLTITVLITNRHAGLVPCETELIICELVLCDKLTSSYWDSHKPTNITGINVLCEQRVRWSFLRERTTMLTLSMQKQKHSFSGGIYKSGRQCMKQPCLVGFRTEEWMPHVRRKVRLF